MTDRPLLRVPRAPHRDHATHSMAQIDVLQAKDVTQLVQARAWPSVTVTLGTDPAPRMLPADGERLHGLLRQADEQLAALEVDTADLRGRLASLGQEALSAPTGRGLALFASPGLARALRLPVAVEARVVIEGTFRTREVLQSLHRTPPHLLLVLRSTSAQLYRGHADTLVPAGALGFPVEHTLPVLGALESGEDQLTEFVRRVDAALGVARQRRPAPIIIAGDVEPVQLLLSGSRNLDRLAGVVTGHAATSLPTMYAEARLALEEYLLSREREALDALASAVARDPHGVHSGALQCWDAAHAVRPIMLVVEEGHAFPALLNRDGVRAEEESATGRSSAADTRYDLVDDLIETVINRGGWVAFAHNGSLSEHERVALVSRTDSPA